MDLSPGLDIRKIEVSNLLIICHTIRPFVKQEGANVLRTASRHGGTLAVSHADLNRGSGEHLQA